MAAKVWLTGVLLSMQGVLRPSRAAPPLRRRFALALLGAALLHALFFAGLDRTWRAPAAAASRVSTALWVQELEPVAPAPPEVQATEPARVVPSGAKSPARGARAPGSGKEVGVGPSPSASAAAANSSSPDASAATPPPVVDRAELAVAPAQRGVLVAENEPRPQANAPAAPHEPEPAVAAAQDSVPTYATRIPASAVLQYRMRRGMVHGSAELTWRFDAGRYEARLEARTSGIALLTQVSQGGVDATGLAPQRFTDKRVRRSAVAANFQREAGNGAGKISFSGSEAEIELHPGTQDRLSWMVQLAAIAGAGTKLLAAQGRIAMHVVGAHGDSAVWQFLSSGEEQIGGNPVAMRVFRLQRLPQTPYDTQVDVWLDAAPPHWPVRAHWRSNPQDPGMELWRTDIAEPP